MTDPRERLLEAAARIYAEQGFLGATTRRIATEAGVNEVTLFRQFGSKEALLRASLERAGAEILSPGLPESPSDPAAEVARWAVALWEQLAAHRSMIRTCMGEIETHPEIMPTCGSPGSANTAAKRALCHYVKSLQESGRARRDVDPGPAASLLMGAIFADAMSRDLMPEMYSRPARQTVTEYVRLFLRAVLVECA
ncbi:MAG TPA: helix-turn-helix domain-containing protein [Gemmatimonadales bacterium]|jgi:AcrR family transcriptional regulator|nr:helix-turn-helix domain-containing protein [Gemmatimonadales bacterium]